ncbi:Kelch repeat-containing protein [Sorangium sp. So ce887]|uniref:Kelch repeat-containing protein n=1 Tax=Sorangium sp. So ce887 TaxID=3133324 RepID=UPI003F647664
MKTLKLSQRCAVWPWICVISGIGSIGCGDDGGGAGQPEPSGRYPRLPEAAGSFGAAVLDDFVYVAGGHVTPAHVQGSGFSRDDLTPAFRRLDLESGQAWEELDEVPPLEGLTLVSHGGYVIRVGGLQIENAPGETEALRSVPTVERYDPDQAAWSPLPELPEGRSGHGAVVIGDILYVVAGWKVEGTSSSGTFTTGGYQLDLSTDGATWEPIPEPPFKSRSLAVSALGDKIYAMGGVDEAQAFTAAVHVLDTKEGTWTEGPPLPEAPFLNAFGAASCSVAGKLYVNYAAGLFRLNEAGDGWETAGTLKTPRIFNGLLCRSERELVALGGFNLAQSSDPLDDVEVVSIQ